MRLLFFYLCFAFLLLGCKMEADNSANLAFEANSKTVLANLQGFQNENLDYSMYSKEFAMMETTFGAEKESITLDEMIASNKEMWETFDFKMLTDPAVLLPGVNPDTKMSDGSVRLYSAWEVSLPATDSTEAKTGVIRLYESFDFDPDGKILTQQIYGDFTGLMMYLMGGN